MDTNQNLMNATETLRSLMESVGVSSYRSLARRAGVSLWQIQQLRQGRILQMRLEHLISLSQYFHLSVNEFMALFLDSPDTDGADTGLLTEHPLQPLQSPDTHDSETGSGEDPLASIEQEDNSQYQVLKVEYDRLQQQMKLQRSQVIEAQIQDSLNLIESWMLQWPTAASAAKANDTIPASRLIPLVHPIEALLKRWGVQAIATVGDMVPYDPSQHQLMNGTAHPGDTVRVRYVGYRLNEKLLHRAKVSPVAS